MLSCLIFSSVSFGYTLEKTGPILNEAFKQTVWSLSGKLNEKDFKNPVAYDTEYQTIFWQGEYRELEVDNLIISSKKVLYIFSTITSLNRNDLTLFSYIDFTNPEVGYDALKVDKPIDGFFKMFKTDKASCLKNIDRPNTYVVYLNNIKLTVEHKNNKISRITFNLEEIVPSSIKIKKVALDIQKKNGWAQDKVFQEKIADPEGFKAVMEFLGNTWIPISVDTVFIQSYKAELDELNISDLRYTTEEGKFSCYIDAVNGAVKKSSFDNKEYKLNMAGDFTHWCMNFLETFKKF